VALTWSALAAAIAVPIIAAAMSPLLAWRGPVYIIAGFAGIVALGLLLAQPLLVGGYMPGLSPLSGRRTHRWIGSLLVIAVLIHVGALWVTSAPDVIDALLFASPTPFSAWGVIAMWAIFAAALLVVLRRRLRLRPRTWRIGHTFLAVVTVAGSVLHAVLIEGTMETVTKVVLCILVIGATTKVISDLRVWSKRAT
jgi:predicted ferric reductase